MQTTLNDKLLDIWVSSFLTNTDFLQPLYFDAMQQNSVLFVGMNPSFNERVLNKVLANVRPAGNENARKVFSWRGRKNLEKLLCIAEQRRSKLE